jgi:hypothetical protein
MVDTKGRTLAIQMVMTQASETPSARTEMAGREGIVVTGEVAVVPSLSTIFANFFCGPVRH